MSKRHVNGQTSRVTPANPESPSALDEHPQWRRWGPYLAARQWGTVREDYSSSGTAWEFFPHDHARSRVYRWGDDGLLGISDDEGLLCFAPALWNGADPIIKERLFGLTGNEGNHGEDVKEAYFFLDNMPRHTYMQALYKYPQNAYPYEQIVRENGARGRQDDEFELADTGIFAEQRYFDITVEYAKAAPDDILIRISATNHGPDPAPLHLLPTLWFRNTWGWGRDLRKPGLQIDTKDGLNGHRQVHAHHWTLGDYWLVAEGAPDLLFTDNETNADRIWGVPNATPYVKDGINEAVVNGNANAVNPEGMGTKVAAHYTTTLAPGETQVFRLRLSRTQHRDAFATFSQVFEDRIAEADAFYAALGGDVLTEDERRVQRQAYAGLLWSKQFYYYDVSEWLKGDPVSAPPQERRGGRNAHWSHVNNGDVISMPDTWEYPWFAAWDLAFHCVSFAHIDPAFAKDQLILLLREWYMHPNGQLPAYEWAFGDVNPPVHAWAAWQVYQTEREMTGTGDRVFLERVFHKLMLNFTWWVNRKDSEDKNIFQGGFLGLDNIGVFDRSAPLPTGGFLEQSDGTAWMGMFSLNMMAIALELARENIAYEDTATKFFEHFLFIAGAMNDLGGDEIDIWDEEDGFFYDVLMTADSDPQRLRVSSLVGLIPMLAVETIDPELHHILPNFSRRMRWFLNNRPDLATLVPSWEEPGAGKHRLLSLVPEDRLRRLLTRMLDTDQFLAPHGIRSVSKVHKDAPYEFVVDGNIYAVDYEPAESRSGLFGGNSNWRGPVWFPINVLLIEALRSFHHYYGDTMTVECPTGSDTTMNLEAVSNELARRLAGTFLRDEDGKRPVYDSMPLQQNDPEWRDHILFYEYFHGDTGAGLGASHQTGWTALVARLITEMAIERQEQAATQVTA